MEVPKEGKYLINMGSVCWSRSGVGCDRGGQREGEIDGGAKKRAEHRDPKGG